jgi:hypothetical protein
MCVNGPIWSGGPAGDGRFSARTFVVHEHLRRLREITPGGDWLFEARPFVSSRKTHHPNKPTERPCLRSFD